MAPRKLTILSGGAAHGLVSALAPQFSTQTGCEIDGTFGAVGAMRDKLLAGAPADLLILTQALIAELADRGLVVPGSAIDIGTVATAIAIRSGAPAPQVGDADGLRAALLAADAVYFPDPQLATAGIHFARVMERLGISEQLAPRLKPFPNGASAMRELAASESARPIGCTQVTEIINTPGVQLVAPLPSGYELETVYTAAVTSRAALPNEARVLAQLLANPSARAARDRSGFT
jgi:molybdate transport system substrate-binding protein